MRLWKNATDSYFGRALKDNAAVWFELNQPDSYDEAKTFLGERTFLGRGEASKIPAENLYGQI